MIKLGEEKKNPPPKHNRGLQADDGDTTKRAKAKRRVAGKIGRPTNIDSTPEVLPFESTLAYVFRASGGKQTALEAARLVSLTDERFKRLVHAYDSASETDKSALVLEDLCAAADVTPDEFLANIVPALWRRNVDLGRVISAVSHPKVVEATIKNATTGGSFGLGDRKLLLEHEGFIQTRQGMQINVDASHKTLQVGKGNGSPEDTAKTALPSFAEDMMMLDEALNKPTKGLLSRSLVALPPPEKKEPPILEGETEDV